MNDAKTQSPSQGAGPEGSAAAPAPARFSLVRVSKDGKLCLFKDADGHLTAVRASKLA